MLAFNMRVNLDWLILGRGPMKPETIELANVTDAAIFREALKRLGTVGERFAALELAVRSLVNEKGVE